MNKSITYSLSWAGLCGIISAQLLFMYHQIAYTYWSLFVLLMAFLPIKGFIQNNRYTFQWSGFLSLFFLCVGVSNFFVDATPKSTSFLLLCSSVIFYFGVVFHAKKLAYYEALNKSNKQNPF